MLHKEDASNTRRKYRCTKLEIGLDAFVEAFVAGGLEQGEATFPCFS